MSGDVFVKIVCAILSIVVTLVSAYVAPAFKKWIATKIDDNQMESLYKIIVKGVQCAEQIYTPEEWEQKKKYVMNYVSSMINSVIKVELKEEQLDTIVEAIVYEVKHASSQ